MRIALSNWSNRLAGGAETYLSSIAGKLRAEGHAVSLWHERSEPAGRPLIPGIAGLATWNAAELGVGPSLGELAAWKPDLVYCQGMLDPANEAATLSIAPGVFFAHNFHGICISGSKTTALPVIQPCRRRFGPACLLHYYPRRCGGLNPVTMLREFRLNRNRLATLATYAQVITHSRWLQQEYSNHGINCRQVRFFSPRAATPLAPPRSVRTKWRLLLMGRMVETKGGRVFLESLREVAAGTRKPLRVVMAGDGPSRPAWEAQARALMDSMAGIEVLFPGWLDARQLETELAATDLLVMPSLWPEPFGLAGLEAASMGVPAVGFALGGIPDWLTDGVSGALAPADPPRPASLAAAILRCLSSDEYWSRLREGAWETARRMTLENHYEDLMRVFESVLQHRKLAVA